MAEGSALSPRSSSKGRANKIYRTPATPPPDILRTKEKTFVLDCNATSSISCDYSRANPKLGPVIPPYNSQRDRHVDQYFTFHGVPRTLTKTGQMAGGNSIEGPVMDSFHTRGAGYQYLSLRNQFGAGHSRDCVDGHAQFMEGVKPMEGYNGRYGFRRNTPWLRKNPSPFHPNSIAPTF
ncbi:sperm microtubule associated protein 1-like [Littorina saxatilis]|uniref:sperm microtubule associated protein 1-like n=1 Tax=Littorina saxatilis TaxID=31220 RepID=UPI0038B53553